MKRTVKPFVVERKRRTAAAGDGPPSIWSKADGAAFREQAGSERRKDMPAKPATPRPVAHASNNPRILDVSSPKPESVASAIIAEKPTRTRRAVCPLKSSPP